MASTADVLVLEILTASDDHAVSERLSGQLNARVHHDNRRQHVAIGHHARAEERVIVAISPTETGLRATATRLAWAAPEGSIIVALDAGVCRVGPPGTLAGAEVGGSVSLADRRRKPVSTQSACRVST